MLIQETPTGRCSPHTARCRACDIGESEEALAEGLALYEAGKYPQAIAQFRKVLGIDPENAEAPKHLDYAENLAHDDTLSDRFTRLE
jgi:tetratricopeptide (TPR) repeat protein